MKFLPITIFCCVCLLSLGVSPVFSSPEAGRRQARNVFDMSEDLETEAVRSSQDSVEVPFDYYADADMPTEDVK